MNYWYIWFEIFENGKKVGSGRYYQAYSYKGNAVRRAKQMWGKDFYSPMTGSTISRKWIVSQTNPYVNIPLVEIQNDGKLMNIEDHTALVDLVFRERSELI